MQVVGYTDRLSAAPGESIQFMVSCKSSAYRVDIVRLIHGDTHPDGPGFKEEEVEAPVNREYQGRFQAIERGSHISVPDRLASAARRRIHLVCLGLPDVARRWGSRASSRKERRMVTLLMD